MLSAHAHNLAQYVGIGRQQAAGMELSDIDAAAHMGYVLYRLSSSLNFVMPLHNY